MAQSVKRSPTEKKTSLRIHHNLGPQKFRRFCRKTFNPDPDPWDDCIFTLHLVDFCTVNVGKYTIHGSYGKGNWWFYHRVKSTNTLGMNKIIFPKNHFHGNLKGMPPSSRNEALLWDCFTTIIPQFLNISLIRQAISWGKSLWWGRGCGPLRFP